MQPTPQQADAIHIHDHNLIVVAGAGSGKTRVLVQRYLQLLENNPDWKLNALVAITFTREAAFEMRNRVRKSLEDLVAKTEDENQLSRWAQLLSEMDTARIDTIHGLCVTILRANAAQAGIDPKFEVLDEIEARIILEDIIGDVLRELEPPLTRLFSAYESRKIIETLTKPNLINIDFDPIPDDLFTSWQAEWAESVIQAQQGLLTSNLWQAVQEIEPIDGYPEDDKLGAMYIYYCNAMQDLSSLDSPLDIIDHLQTTVTEGKFGFVGKGDIWGGKDGKKLANDTLRALRNHIIDLLKSLGEPPSDLDKETAEILPLWHEILLRIQTAYRQHKRDNSLLDFDDLERVTAHLLQDESVRTRYRNAEFKHLLVDEFQDTNSAQWKIVQSLASLDRGGSLFVVGDPKQSIYQFRGADVSVFNDVRSQIADNAVGREVPLSVSFRTHHRLIDQFNTIFSRILVKDETSPVSEFEVELDKEMTAFRTKSPEQPAIEIMLMDKNERDKNGEIMYNIPRNGKRKTRRTYASDDMRRWEAYEIATYIQSIVDSGRVIFDKEEGISRPIRVGDVAILFQSMSNITLYEGVFKSLDLPFMTIAGRGYYSRQEVWDMLDLLRALHNPADNLSLATALRSPMFSFSDDMLLALRLLPDENPDKRDPMPLWNALHYACENDVMGITANDLEIIQFTVDTLDSLRLIAGRVTISELLRQTLAKTGYLAILTGLPDGARRRGNIEKLLQLAENSGKITLGKFSQYLNDLSSREIREGEAIIGADTAVKMMTVHASKGLEFPIVVLADASWERGSAGGAPTLLHDKEQGLSCQVFDEPNNKYISAFAHRKNYTLQQLREDAERKRLLYVAATRAQDFLVLSGQVSWDRDKGTGSTKGWLKQLMTAMELDGIDYAIDQTVEFANDEVRIMLPPQPPPQDILYADAIDKPNLWGYQADKDDFPPIQPPLIGKLPITLDAQIGHISATQIADLGGVHYGSDADQREFYRQRFRRRTLHDEPSRIQDLSAERQQVSQRLIGEIVHEVIRYWKFDLEPRQFEAMLEGYAWQKGLTSDYEREEAIRRTRSLLNRFQQSIVFGWIDSAKQDNRPLYTELPFILRTEKRVIHGVIDVLFQQADGTWMVLDYKTSKVNDGNFDYHAQRYYLQVGVYASAVQEQLGGHIIPQTHIHYIRESRTVHIPTDAWRTEIDKLEDYIGELVTADG